MDIMLAHKYESQNCEGWLVSEKLDGCYSYWTGKKFLSRQGLDFNVPKEFIENFPDVVMCGELWAGRDNFELTGVLRMKEPTMEDFKNIKFIAFDMPESTKKFSERLEDLRLIAEKHPCISVIKTWKFTGHDDLMKQLKEYEDMKCEGLMLHNPDALYEKKRSKNLLKVKSFSDGEATVIGYSPGSGKYEGKTGALKVKTDEGLAFKLGTGLKDADRENPPAIGSIVTYRYNDTTKNGIPRFPRYIGIRIDSDLKLGEI
jgi:DNA ligase-1